MRQDIRDMTNKFGDSIRYKVIRRICETSYSAGYGVGYGAGRDLGILEGRRLAAADAYAFGHYEGFQYARANPTAVILNPPENPMHKYEVKYEETE